MRINILIVLMACWAGSSAGQGYRVGLCPGGLTHYETLAREIESISTTNESAALDLIHNCLVKWEKNARLSRFIVEIRRLDKQSEKQQVWVWRKRGTGTTSVFAAASSVESTAGRGGGMGTDNRPGDNQRCFFQDTTVIVDELHIRRGEFPETQTPQLTIAGKTYTLPLNDARTDWIVNRAVLAGVSAGQYQSATVTLGEGSSTSLVLYILTDDERAQLILSTRQWQVFEPIACTRVVSRLVDYLAQNWGGKYCASPSLYLYAQRAALQRLLTSQHLTCSP